jgi:hypothetical protein
MSDGGVLPLDAVIPGLEDVFVTLVGKSMMEVESGSEG